MRRAMSRGFGALLLVAATMLVCGVLRAPRSAMADEVRCEPEGEALEDIRSAIVEVEAGWGRHTQKGVGVIVTAHGHLLLPMHVVRCVRDGLRLARLRLRMDQRIDGPQRGLLLREAQEDRLGYFERSFQLVAEDPQHDLALIDLEPGPADPTRVYRFLTPTDAPLARQGCIYRDFPRPVPMSKRLVNACEVLATGDGGCGAADCRQLGIVLSGGRARPLQSRAYCVNPYRCEGSTSSLSLPVFDFGDGASSASLFVKSLSGTPVFAPGGSSFYGVLNLVHFGARRARGVAVSRRDIDALVQSSRPRPDDDAPAQPCLVGLDRNLVIADEYVSLREQSGTASCQSAHELGAQIDKLRSLSIPIATDDSALDHPLQFSPENIEETEREVRRLAAQVAGDAACQSAEVRSAVEVVLQTLALRRTLGSIRTLWSVTREALIYPELESLAPRASLGERFVWTPYCLAGNARPLRRQWLTFGGAYLNPIEQALACELNVSMPVQTRVVYNAYMNVSTTDVGDVYRTLRRLGLAPDGNDSNEAGSDDAGVTPGGGDADAECATRVSPALCESWGGIRAIVGNVSWLSLASDPRRQAELWTRAIDGGLIDPSRAFVFAAGVDPATLEQRARLLQDAPSTAMQTLCNALQMLPVDDESNRLREAYGEVSRALRDVPPLLLTHDGRAGLNTLLRSFADPSLFTAAFQARDPYIEALQREVMQQSPSCVGAFNLAHGRFVRAWCDVQVLQRSEFTPLYLPMEQNLDTAASELKRLADDAINVAGRRLTGTPGAPSEPVSSQGLPCMPPSPVSLPMVPVLGV